MMKNEDTQVVARNMAAHILTNSMDAHGETIQGILNYINENGEKWPAAASLMEAVLQNLCEALEPEQAIL